MLTLIARIDSGAATTDLTLPSELREKSRLRAKLADGEDAAVLLPRGSVLRDGDLLLGDDGRVVRVVAAVEATYRVLCATPEVYARCAYHLGNRHAAVELRGAHGGQFVLRIREDGVFKDMLVGLGARVEMEQAPFEPEPGAYAGGHHHHSVGAQHSGVIHDYPAPLAK